MVNLYLANGKADSLIVATLSNWNATALKIPALRKDTILEIAEDLYNDCPMQSEYYMENWSREREHKYIANDYPIWKKEKCINGKFEQT